jgi:basic amino acid/polyamine antiporter, APA family
VYVLSGVTAKEVAGPSVIVSYLCASVAALLAALCYTEFAVDLPITGGAFNYISVTFGELAAWSVGWNMILETLLSSSAVARGFSGYLCTLVGIETGTLLFEAGPLRLDPLALGLIALLTAVLAKGTRESSTFNITVCSINLSCIAFVLVLGLPLGRVANLTPFSPFGLGHGTFAGASILFFAFVGFDYIANVAEEVSNPTRDLPIGILTSLGVATIL